MPDDTDPNLPGKLDPTTVHLDGKAGDGRHEARRHADGCVCVRVQQLVQHTRHGLQSWALRT